MNKFFIIIFIFVWSANLFSEEKEGLTVNKIQGSKEMPLELNLLISSLENTVGPNKILQLIMNIDSYARVLSKEDIFLIGKVEIYKTLLKSNDRFPMAIINSDSNKILRDAILKASDPFIKWFLQALLQDCELLLENSNYKDYVLQKNNGPLLNVELKKIDKKVQLLFRWVSKISPDSPDFQELLKTELAPVLMDSLINIEESFFLMATGTNFAPFPGLINSPSELKFFTLKQMKVPKKAVKTEKTLDDFLGSIIDGPKPTEGVLPEPSKEDWLNKEDAPLNLKNLPKPSDDADWLQDF